ncbi:hypothetical protein DO97_12115 [Neosynechococcus sphagnicola sy1]|uniref:Response regulatory domain-containing protein n=1 Tax=Neosynechococcus sphagnicola sy1 TaxID=1497020 RepID=A0A098TJ66_9CYAN|nr:hypothetical protein [Neosynechococcus sphagnicola]KGF72091.1 hypothetical protein DO97_12115 [Neosynechococcus sphagnicola sy1]
MEPSVVKVLLVTEDKNDYGLIQVLLSEIETATFNLEWVTTASAALGQMPQNHHQVYLVDYRLGGLELLHAAIAQGCRGPIILLIHPGDQTIDVAAFGAIAVDILIKGRIEASLLERAIRYGRQHTHTLTALHESESKLGGILNSLMDVVWSLSATTLEVLYISPAVQRVYGRSEAEFFCQSSSLA